VLLQTSTIQRFCRRCQGAGWCENIGFLFWNEWYRVISKKTIRATLSVITVLLEIVLHIPWTFGPQFSEECREWSNLSLDHHHKLTRGTGPVSHPHPWRKQPVIRDVLVSIQRSNNPPLPKKIYLLKTIQMCHFSSW
jgi:hypothetical protein